MSERTRIYALAFVIMALLLTTMILGARLNAGQTRLSGNYGPPTRQPMPGTGGLDIGPDAPENQTVQELQVLSGHGKDQARNAYGTVLASLPFAPHLPSKLPDGMTLYHVDANLEGEDKIASFGALYVLSTSKGRIDLHTFQTQENIPQHVNPEAQLNWAEVKPMVIGSNQWKYIRLVYPQPDGTNLQTHYISRTFEDGIYVSFDIKGGDPAEGLVLLKQVAADIK